MKKDTFIYWTSTVIIAILMGYSAFNFAFNEEYKYAFQNFGLPDWFKVELTVAKFLGVAALLIPAVPAKVKEFAYFGFALTLVSADIAHMTYGDPVWYVAVHFTFLCILAVSYTYFHKKRRFLTPANAKRGAGTSW